MQAIERIQITRAIRAAAKAGFVMVAVNEGGDDLMPVTTEAEVLDAIDAVDFDGNKRRPGLFCVIGNGADVISDYTCCPGFEEAIERVGEVDMDVLGAVTLAALDALAAIVAECQRARWLGQDMKGIYDTAKVVLAKAETVFTAD
jgi:hypothetical protein